MSGRITSLPIKSAEREELEAALRRFQASGGQVEAVEIKSHCEDYLREHPRTFDLNSTQEAKAYRQQEAARKPLYIRTIKAIKIKEGA